MESPVSQDESVAGPATIPTVWLRTCYSPGSDQRHKERIGSAKLFETVDDKHRILNDPLLYSFGDDWEQVFDAFPQLLEPDCGNWKQRQCEARALLEHYSGSSSTPSREMDHLSYVDDVEMEEHVAQVVQSDVHKAFVVSRLVLEDAESMETGEVAVIFVDAFGRVVRTKRIAIGDLQQMEELRVNADWDDFEDWEDAELGEDYEVGGLCEDLLVKRSRA
ncbi:MAG: hypothetical protein Q9216_004196 [Gyalolechia sp. 2 TL-2023]